MVSTKHIENGASAKAWVDFCIAAIGAGKGGGKADQANGSIPGGEDVLSIVLTKAEEFALSFSK